MLVLSLVALVRAAPPDPRGFDVAAGPIDARPDWARFQQQTGGGWRVVRDGRGAAHLVGGTILVGPVADEAAAVAAVESVVRAWSGLSGVQADSLRLPSARRDARTDAWYVSLGQAVGDIPVWRAGVRAQIRHGRIVTLVLDGHDALPEPRLPVIDGRGALARAQAADLRSPRLDGPATLTWLPPQPGADWALVWALPLRPAVGPGRFVRFVDAADGRIVAGYDDGATLEGVMVGEYDTRPLGGPTSDAAMPDLTLTGSAGGAVTTSADGAFSTDDSETWTAALSGPYIRVTNDAGDEGSLTITDEAPRWTPAAATQAEIDAWVSLHRMVRWMARFSPDNPLLGEQLRAKVNTGTPCNGYYDGAVNFGVADAECNNYAQVADVVYHEWGHAFHEHSLLYGAVDPTMGEGFADVITSLQTLDPQIAPGAFVDGRALRELEPDLRYPEDWSEVYYVAELIYAGAAWDLFVRLQADYGEAGDVYGTAWEVSSQLLADAIRSGPDLFTIADAYLLADDDDGDLSNGTPHMCAIVESFGAHGLGPGADPFPVSWSVTPADTLLADTPTLLEGNVQSAAPGCVDVAVAAVELYTSTDGVRWEMTPATLSGSAFSVTLPAQPAGTVLSYYLLARSAGGVEVTAPPSRWAPYTAYVGPLDTIWCAPTDDDGGFTHSLADGSGGWDDWEYGVPGGKSGDPHEAWSGAAVWGTDLGAGADDGAYPRAVDSALAAPPIEVAGHAQVVLRYRRWLTVEDGARDLATITANGAAVWANHTSAEGTEGTFDAGWMLHTVAIPTGGADTLDLAWTLRSDSGEVHGGWNLDDVCVYAAPAAPGDTADTGDTASPEDTDSPDDPTDTGPKSAGEGCGCATGGAPPAAPLLALIVLLTRRSSSPNCRWRRRSHTARRPGCSSQ